MAGCGWDGWAVGKVRESEMGAAGAVELEFQNESCSFLSAGKQFQN
jgi:hypothetical protein